MIAFCVIVALIIIILLIYNLSYNNRNTIRVLVRQAARWSLAAKQDNELMIAILHANYGAAYLWAVRDIATDEEIRQATGVDILRLRDDIISVQDDVTRRLVHACPDFAPKNGYIQHIATTV